MKKNNLIRLISILGFIVLYAITVARILKSRNFKLFFYLFINAVLWWFGFLIIPMGILVKSINTFFHDMWLKNIFYCVLWVFTYLIGVFITHKLLIWQQKNVCQGDGSIV